MYVRNGFTIEIYRFTHSLRTSSARAARDAFSFAMAVEDSQVRHGDVTAGVKRAWNVITVDKCSFFHRGMVLPVFCTSAGPMDALKVQGSNSNTKVSRVQVHSLSEGPTRGLGSCQVQGKSRIMSYLRCSAHAQIGTAHARRLRDTHQAELCAQSPEVPRGVMVRARDGEWVFPFLLFS